MSVEALSGAPPPGTIFGLRGSAHRRGSNHDATGGAGIVAHLLPRFARLNITKRVLAMLVLPTFRQVMNIRQSLPAQTPIAQALIKVSSLLHVRAIEAFKVGDQDEVDPVHTILDNRRFVMATKKSARRTIKLAALVLGLLTGTSIAHAADVTPLMAKELPDIPGKEVLIITVEKAPGGLDPIHRHNAHAFIYVLEGSIVMQVEGGQEVTLTPGQTWYESPNDVHAVGRNASNTKPVKFLVVLIKDKGAPVLVPVK
jgi:quercetin dioxygenase-like cupin family protein